MAAGGTKSFYLPTYEDDPPPLRPSKFSLALREKELQERARRGPLVAPKDWNLPKDRDL